MTITFFKFSHPIYVLFNKFIMPHKISAEIFMDMAHYVTRIEYLHIAP